MALTLSYAVKRIKIKDETNSDGVLLENAVCNTYWEVTGTDEEGRTAMWSGATPFTAANVPAASFVAFEDLQESDVLGWITNVVENDPTYKAHIESQLRRLIEDTTVAEVTGSSLPWEEDDVAPEGANTAVSATP